MAKPSANIHTKGIWIKRRPIIIAPCGRLRTVLKTIVINNMSPDRQTEETLKRCCTLLLKATDIRAPKKKGTEYKMVVSFK